jgi:hypothetical protein
VERPTSLSPVRLIWAAPTACSPFCAIAGIASNKQPPVTANRADDEGPHKGWQLITPESRVTLSIAARKHGVSLPAMKSRLFVFVSLIIASFLLTPFLPAQDTDKDVDDAIQEATESAKKMGVKMPDVKKQIDEVNKEEAKEKAALQKQLEAPGPVALPDWTPKLPQFKHACRF